jgi:predicted permease
MRLSDIVQAARSLARTPWYAAALAGVIALSMALSTTVFAIVDGALFKPLPYRASGQLFAISTGWSKLAEPSRRFGIVSPAEFDDWRRTLPDVQMSAFYVGDTRFVGEREFVSSARVDASFFEVIGMWPALGGFAPGDFELTGPIRPAIVTHGFWRQRLGGDPSAIGRTLSNNAGEGVRVVGILPADFVFPFPSARFSPVLLTPLVPATPRSQGGSVQALVRVLPSMTARETAERLSVLAAQWAAAHPPTPGRPEMNERARILRSPFDRVGLDPIRSALTSDLSEKAWVVFAAAAAVVLLGCLNVAGLTIARMRDRWRDLAVRRSLGARNVDLIRLLAVESSLIVATGAAAGVAGAYGMLSMTLRLLGPSYLVVLKPAAIDLRVLAFAVGTAVCAVAFVTLLSARAASRVDLRRAIAEGGGTTRRERARVSIVTLEVALALVVTVGGALVAGSLLRVWNEDPGFDTRWAALISMSAPEGASAAMIEELVSDIIHMPGVDHAGGSAHPILEHAFNGSEFDGPAGTTEMPPGSRFPIEGVPVTHGYFEAAGLPLRDGRAPTAAEFVSGSPVIVVTETVARHYWPGRRAVGQSLLNNGREYAVVGVVPDARFMSLDLEPQGEIYWPVAAMVRPSISGVLLRFDAGAPAPLSSVVNDLRQRCPSCWIRNAQMLTDALAGTIRPRRFSAWLFSAFGAAALVIVGTGLLGLVAMATNRRTREIGIRMALGATRANVLGQLLREQVAAVSLGICAGGLVAAWLVRFVESYLYKTSVYDPSSWTAAIAALLLVAAAGAFVPSRHASRIDPIQALKAE